VDKPSINNVAGWCEKGVELSHARRLQQFEIADWLAEGTRLFADATAAYDFAEQTFPDVARQTLINWVSVARQYPACMRIQSDWLTFSHYQVVLGAKGGIPLGNESRYDGVPLIESRLSWLQQAHDKRMTVAQLRLAVANETVLMDFPEMIATESEPDPAAEPPVVPQTTVTKPVHFLRAPVYSLLSAHAQKIQALARARRISPEMLVADAVAEYLEAHSNEVADAVAKNNEDNERKFQDMVSAARHVKQQTQRRSLMLTEWEDLSGGAAKLSRSFPDDEPLFAQSEPPTLQQGIQPEWPEWAEVLEAA
jgi:hypothetical protein